MGLYTNFGEIFIPGISSCEFWTLSGDPSAPFQKIPGATLQIGCIAPDSVELIEHSYFYLDSLRMVVRLTGRQFTIVSNSIDKELQELSAVGDAYGQWLYFANIQCYVLSFPTAQRTFIYDYKKDTWPEWSTVTGGTAPSLTRREWFGTLGARAEVFDVLLRTDCLRYFIANIGSGMLEIGQLEMRKSNDSGLDTTFNKDIQPDLTTGRLDYGTLQKKKAKKITLKVIFHADADKTEITLNVFARYNGSDTWTTIGYYQTTSSVSATETNEYIEFACVGIYRDVQYRIIADGPISILGMEEVFDVIEEG